MLQAVPSNLRTWLLCLACLAAGILSGSVLRHELTSQGATLDVDALIDKGTRFNVYYNNQWSELVKQDVTPNKWTRYEFKVPSKLTALRLDPSEQDSASILIRSIKLQGSRGDSKSINLAELSQWIGVHIKAVPQPDRTVLLTTNGRDSYLMSTVDLSVGGSRRAFSFLRLNSTTLLWCFAACLAVTLLLIIGRKNLNQGIWVLLVLIASAGAVHWLGDKLVLIRGELPSAREAIGAAAFSGFSFNSELRAINLPLASAMLIAAAAALAWRFRNRQTLLPRFDLRSQKTGWLAFGLLVLAAAVCAYPPTSTFLKNALSGTHPTDFDSQNIFAWDYLTIHHKLPFRDFWYPYSGFYLRNPPLFPNFLIQYFHNLLLLAVLLWCGLKTVHKRWPMLVLFAAVFYFFEAQHIFWPGSASRYFLGIAATLLAAVAIQEISISLFVALGLWVVYVVTQEISQIVYAGPSLAMLLLVGFLSTDGVLRRAQLLRAYLAGVVSGAVALVIYLVNLLIHGQLFQWWLFLRELSVSATYGAWPAQIASWLQPSGALDSAYLVLTAILITGGVLHILLHDGEQEIYALLPLSFGLISWFALQKQIVRPGIETQLMAFPVFGLLLLVYQQLSPRFRTWYLAWPCFAMGLLLACFVYQSADPMTSVIPWYGSARDFAANVVATFKRTEWKKARETYFAASSFNLGGVSGEQYVEQLRAGLPLQPGESIFILGNEPLVYIWLNKPIPFYTSLYNQSPMEAQSTTIRWIREHNPAYVLWDSGATDFDGVPNTVRLPLLYEYVADHYKPAGAAVNFQVLKRLETGDAPDLAYWNRMLGTTIDLGYVPAASALHEGESGSVNAPGLSVHLTKAQDGAKITIPIAVGQRNYSLNFFSLGKRCDYLIRLDRIPVVECALDSARSSARVSGMPADMRASVETIRVPADDLY